MHKALMLCGPEIAAVKKLFMYLSVYLLTLNSSSATPYLDTDSSAPCLTYLLITNECQLEHFALNTLFFCSMAVLWKPLGFLKHLNALRNP